MKSLKIVPSVTEEGNWKDAARCKGRSEFFFPPLFERPIARHERERVAELFCENCLVKQQCRDIARNNQEFGFWGGESERDRVTAGFKAKGFDSYRFVRSMA